MEVLSGIAPPGGGVIALRIINLIFGKRKLAVNYDYSLRTVFLIIRKHITIIPDKIAGDTPFSQW
jgi:hypothetical protein